MHYRMMNDYSADWPLWGDDGQCPDGEPALPPRLDADVRQWAADFDGGYSYEFGWQTKARADEHRRRGRGLFGAVQRVVEAEGHTVELAYWETAHRKGF
ncbi:hypothetical protein [Curtobacterium sp. MCBD17_021]|uniref:hypothetical protein n=1 Tax=Curtobacterium sp. MCBD17_021 TaxID=2175665 RepID=UPI0011B6765C|nr:hypothetical protein [Curtobacterium sp. MCBD17_021]